MDLPEKPAAVAHVSDAHWEAALKRSHDVLGRGWGVMSRWEKRSTDINALWIDHARCLVLLGEVDASIDPIESALASAYAEWIGTGSQNTWRADFERVCRKHFAGLTFPVQP